MTTPPQPPPGKKNETFAAHAPALIASAVVTVGMSFLASFLGTAGTVAGLGLGAILSGTGSWYGERGIRLAAAKAKARKEAARRRGRPLTPAETGLIDMRAEADHRRRSGPGKRLPLAVAGAIAASALVAGITVTGLTAAATGRTVAQVVQGRQPASSGRPEHSPAPSLPPSNTPSTASSGSDAVPTPSASADTAPSPSPDEAPSSPFASVTASATPFGSPAAEGSP